MPRLWAIVPAAGAGKRFGSSMPKQFLTLHGKPVMVWSIDALCQLPLAGCVVAIAATDQQSARFHYAQPDLIEWVTGGAERMDSVRAGLDALASKATLQDWVLVHDVARPCIRLDSLERLIATLSNEPVGGILAVPVRDTLKRANSDGTIDITVRREGMWQAQTPQMFRYGLLRDALERAAQEGPVVTDEASAVEQLGHKVRLVEGRLTNLKITYPEDLELANGYLVDR